MTRTRMTALVAWWVRIYTRGLPAPIARRRIDEIAADLHDHIAHERANGVGEQRIAVGIASRLLRGFAADVAWRTQHAPPGLARPVLRIAFGVALLLAVPFVAMFFTDEVVWSLADFVLVGVLLVIIGSALELAWRKAGNLPAAVSIAALGVAAAVLGEADDAPGLVLLGLVLIGSACVMGIRTAQRKS